MPEPRADRDCPCPVPFKAVAYCDDCPYREALKWAVANAAPLADSRVGVKERVRRLNRFRDHLDSVIYPLADRGARD